MAGSSESDEDLVAGRVNRSNHQTTIWAENQFDSFSIGPFELDWVRTEFGGPVIFLVEVAKDSADEGEFEPSAPLDGIMGVGWSAQQAGQSGGTGVIGIGGAVAGRGVFGRGGEGGPGVTGDAGGAAAGVMGFGGPREGTGVFGLGSGGERLQRRGRGGVGVHGVGGHASVQTGANDDVLPGAGVFGQGGQFREGNPARLLLGTGVIGVGGDAGNQGLPDRSNAGSAGVFGQGADATVDGPGEPGAGAVGRGGISTDPRIPPAAGVIGLAGGRDKPSIFETRDAGLYGLGSTGVRGVGVAGQGVRGSSDVDRGGAFSSDEVAQIQLIPKGVRTVFPDPATVTPQGISPGDIERRIVSLPKNGQGGDLMALVDDSRTCTLWFCVRSGDGSSPARWAQVLLGAPFDGQS
jgi:hypothetical protein